MSKRFLDEGFKELHAHDTSEIQFLKSSCVFNFFPQYFLILGVKGQIVEAHGNEVACRFCSSHKETKKLFYQSVQCIAFFAFKQFFISDAPQNASFFQMLIFHRFCDLFSQHHLHFIQFAVNYLIFREQSHFQNFDSKQKISERMLLRHDVLDENIKIYCQMLPIYFLAERLPEKGFYYRVARNNCRESFGLEILEIVASDRCHLSLNYRAHFRDELIEEGVVENVAHSLPAA